MNSTLFNSRLGRSPRGIGLVAALLVVMAASSAVAADNPSHAVSLQFLHPIATSPNPETDTSVRLSILYGRSASVKVFDLSLAAAATSGDVGGLQLVGLYSGVGGDLRGLSLTGGVHLVQNDVRGVQWSGLVSWANASVTGVQVGGFLSYAETGLRGAQISGLLNMNDGPGGFLQLASVANVNGGDFGGLQLAAFFNHANAGFHGIQAAVANFADTASGAQIGVVNMSRSMSGLQIGVVNLAREFDGVPVGVVNVDGNSFLDWTFYATNLSLANVGLQTDVNGWVSTLSLGYGDAQGDQSEALTAAWNYGRRIVGSREKSLGVDVGWVHIMPKKSDDPAVNDQLHGAFQARLTGDLALKESLALWAGAGASIIYDKYGSGARSETELLIAGGVVLR